jgi:replicative DNA helicase
MNYNHEAEIDLIGCLVLYPEKIDQAQGLIAEDFSEFKRWQLYQATQSAVQEGDADSSKVMQHLKQINPDSKFSEMNWYMENCTGTQKVEYLTSQIKSSTAKRQTLGLIDLARDNINKPFTEFFDGFDAGLAAIKNRLNFGKGTKTIKSAVGDYMKFLGTRMEKDFVPDVVYSGFPDIDNLVGGFRGGNLCVLAGRTGMGKSAAMLNMANKMSLRGRVLVFSLEMDEMELSERFMSMLASVDSMQMRDNPKDISQDDFDSINAAVNKIYSNNKLIIDDTPRISVLEAKNKARQLHAQEPLKAIFFDHIGIMTSGIKNESKRLEVSFITSNLKALAKELNIPVIALSQLNRGETGERPKMSSLKESGSIEEDANQVILLHRPEYYCEACREGSDCKEGHEGLAEWIVDKNRAGKTGVVKMIYKAQYTRFEQISRY